MSLPTQEEANEDYFSRSKAEWASMGGLRVPRSDNPVRRKPDDLGRPRTLIQLHGGEFHEAVGMAEKVLAGDVYARGGQLVRIGSAPELPGNQHLLRQHNQRVILPATIEYLRLRLTELAQFQRFRERARKYIDVDCPREVASNLVGSGHWPQLKPLEAVTSAPFIRADRSICDTAGYDAATGVYLCPAQQFPQVPLRPNREDAESSLKILLDPFSEFPFASRAARTAFVANILTAVARQAIDTSPAFLYTAPLAGTGKSLLASMPNLIAQGVPPAMQPYADDAEELRKVLFSALLAGDSGLLFDNVTSGSKVRSPQLCVFVTASSYGDRVLGQSVAPKLPNRCTITLTGNNLTPAGDFARRALIVRLDANRERVQGRSFRITNLATYVTEQRAKLLVAALTLIRAHTLAAPPALNPLPSFERWSRLVRDPLCWLGCPDPVETQEAEADDEVGPLTEAFARLKHALEQSQFAARDIAVLCEKWGDESSAMREAIEATGCADATNPGKCGYWLRANRDRVAGPWKLKQCGTTHGVSRWKFEAASEQQ